MIYIAIIGTVFQTIGVIVAMILLFNLGNKLNKALNIYIETNMEDEEWEEDNNHV